MSRIPDMASSYLREVREIQPRGPYFLGGFCAGGVVAYEMAQQLVREGEPVGALVMLDTVNPRRGRRRIATRRFLMQVRARSAQGAMNLGGYLGRAAARFVRRRTLAAARFPYRLLGKPLPDRLEFREVSDALYDARRYEPRAYPGRAVLLRGREHVSTLVRNPSMGWGDLVTGGLEIHDIPGVHRDFVRGPVVEVVGEKLREVLERAQAADGGAAPA